MIKEKLQKISKFIVSRMFYLILGICIAVAIPIAYAAWNSTVSSGQTLTTTLWNDVVAKLVELNNRVGNVEGAPYIEFGACGVCPQSYVNYFRVCEWRVCNPSGCSPWYTGDQRITLPGEFSTCWP